MRWLIETDNERERVKGVHSIHTTWWWWWWWLIKNNWVYRSGRSYVFLCMDLVNSWDIYSSEYIYTTWLKYIYIYIPAHFPSGLSFHQWLGRPRFNPRLSYQKLKKKYLMPPCLIFSIIRIGSRVKWSNSKKEAARPPIHLSFIFLRIMNFVFCPFSLSF